MIKHEKLNIAIPSATIASALGVMWFVFMSTPPEYLSFTWRPYVIIIFVAMLLSIAVQTLVNVKVRSHGGTLYWFNLMLIANLGHLAIVACKTLATSPEAASYWQGLLPAAWILIPPMFLLFAITYADSSPFGLRPWPVAATVMGSVLMGYIAIGTNIIESHTPINPVMRVWGWESEPQKGELLVFLWLGIMAITALMIMRAAYVQAVGTRRKQQAKIFYIGFIQYVSLAMAIDVIAYGLGVLWLPPFSPYYTTALVITIAYGVIRHGLFQISPASLSQPILENLAEGVWGINSDDVVEFANPAAGSLMGRQISDIRGLKVAEIFPPKYAAIIAASTRRQEKNFVINDASVLTRNSKPGVLTLRFNQITDDHGRHAGYIVVAQDVTDLKLQAAALAKAKASVEHKVALRTQELHQERAKLRAAIEGLSDGVMLVDADLRVVVQNRALSRMVGLTSEIQQVKDLAHHLDDFDLEMQCRQAIEQARPIESDDISAGSKIIRVFSGPVNVLDGQDIAIIGTVVVMRDITEAKVLERSRDEFFSIASHELRTPLTAIRGNTSMMLDYYKKDIKSPEVRSMLGDVRDASVRLIEIVNDFLDMSRLEQDRMVFNPQSIDVVKTISEAIKELKPLAADHRLMISIDESAFAEQRTAWADPDRVKQILFNLVGNAIKFSAKGEIKISGREESGHIVITVTDDGQGIPVGAQQLLFRKFQQAAASIFTRDSTRGTGLGLYISKLLVEHMGGTIHLDRSEIGKGSTFSFSLPTQQSAPTKVAK